MQIKGLEQVFAPFFNKHNHVRANCYYRVLSRIDFDILKWMRLHFSIRIEKQLPVPITLVKGSLFRKL